MTERERFIKALKREPIEGHCPTFELVFYLTLEAIGMVHPLQQRFDQWNQMSKEEQKMHIDYMADSYIKVAEKYHHSGIFVHPNPGDFDNVVRLLTAIREKTGDKYYIMMHGDPTYEIPEGSDMMEFSIRMYEDLDGMKEEEQRRVDRQAKFAERLANYDKNLLDGFTLCSDYCFNTNPFFSPEVFADLIAPYLQSIIKSYHDMGYYVIKHTDGNIMPIVDQMVQCGPDALHSIDPQAGVDLGEIKRLYGDRVAVCGNVNCGLLQTGTDEEVAADVRRALRDGMNGWGYVFCTSNCAYTGMALSRYEMMNKIWWEEGIYH